MQGSITYHLLSRLLFLQGIKFKEIFMSCDICSVTKSSGVYHSFSRKLTFSVRNSERPAISNSPVARHSPILSPCNNLSASAGLMSGNCLAIFLSSDSTGLKYNFVAGCCNRRRFSVLKVKSDCVASRSERLNFVLPAGFEPKQSDLPF